MGGCIRDEYMQTAVIPIKIKTSLVCLATFFAINKIKFNVKNKTS